jgi:hypothetical protein
VNQATIVLCLLLVVLVLFVPRRLVLLPFIIATCLVPMNQEIIIADLNFTVLRFCVLAGLVRFVVRNEIRHIRWNVFDKLVLAWSVVGSIVYVIQWGSTDAVVYKCGMMFDCLGMYWLFRNAITCWDDIIRVIRYFAFFAIISAPLIMLEKFQQRSFYEIFGPVGAQFHRGRFRCAGPFPHSIMMGLFWTNLLPLFYACIKVGINKSLHYVALAAALGCIALSASSTPIIATAAIIVFWNIYYFRQYGWQILWGVIGVLTALHLVMKAPVWHLISRVDVFSGSTGWHRYQLIDEAVKHFGEWVFLGCRDTGNWSEGLRDVTNQFILEGVEGGFITLAVFIILLVVAIRTAGSYSLRRISPVYQWLAWGICVSLLGHCISFFGVSYFGQIKMLLYLTFAIVGLTYDFLDRTVCSVKAAAPGPVVLET